MASILVLYHARQAPLRQTISDHLYSIRRYSGRPCIYINLAARSIPSWVHRLDIDLVVFHTTLLATRWQPESFRNLAPRLRPIERLACARIAVPQDEFLNTDLLVEFLAEQHVSHVFTCAPPEEWEAIYGPLMTSGVGLTRVLTGYLEPRTVRRIDRLAAEAKKRDIDIGYRSWRAEAWLGRHGMLKTWIAERFLAESQERGLRADISTDVADTLHGDAWYRFLLRCRYTIGAEGGASILDRDGSIRARVEAYTAEHPGAGFDEIERACFPGLDGTFNLRAISPRHLEACATRTPQILVEGSYNGILEPGTHYVPLKANFDNISEIVNQVRDEQGTEMAERAYRDVVAPGRYAYPSFVATLLAVAPAASNSEASRRSMTTRVLSTLERAADRPTWGLVHLDQRLRPIARGSLRRLGLLDAVRQARARRRRHGERQA